MPDRAARQLRLRDEFPPVSTEAWEAAIRRDLGDDRGSDALLWDTDEGIRVRPYYRAEDVQALSTQTAAIRDGLPFACRSVPAPEPDSSSRWPDDAIRADLLHDAGATAVQEVGYALAEGADRLARATEESRAPANPAPSLSFVFAVGSPFFVDIAKLRAARLAWAQVAGAFGADGDAARMRLLVRTARANKSVYDPYTNLLRATTEALSAIVAGCDRLVVEAFGYDAHLADNVPRILIEESHADATADPGGGSYYIERLTDALAREAWGLLQQIEAKGGYRAARAAGVLDAALAASRAARERAVATRRRTLVGVNDYPDPQQLDPVLEPGDAAEERPAASWRLAEPFERLRERTAEYVHRTGRRPLVLLLLRGPLAARTARVTFCLNLFGCGGFAVQESERLEPGADLIVLCSDDENYPAFARDVCSRVETPVVVAGYPERHIDTLRQAGVQGFVHAGSDAVETIAYWQQRLGIGGERDAS